MNVTPTSFDLTIAGVTAGPVELVVTLPNGNSTSTTFDFGDLRRVFVSSVTYDGDLGGIAGADAKCLSLANAAGRTGSWKAWLADSVDSPAARFSLNPVVFYRRYDDTPVASGWADLTDGSLANPISVDETGAPLTSALLRVWTNVETDGTATDGFHCGDWQSETGGGNTGAWGSSDAGWTTDGVLVCSSQKHLYCIQDGPPRRSTARRAGIDFAACEALHSDPVVPG
jgi:hypothetical protein